MKPDRLALTSEEVALARLLYDALQAGDPDAFMTGFETSRPVVIDGEFDLIAAVRKLRDAKLS